MLLFVIIPYGIRCYFLEEAEPTFLRRHFITTNFLDDVLSISSSSSSSYPLHIFKLVKMKLERGVSSADYSYTAFVPVSLFFSSCETRVIFTRITRDDFVN